MKTFKKPGFTIIEVLLVLGIASLIIVMVFVAVAGANRSSRDTRRRADILALSSGLEQWAQNNSGALPIQSASITLNPDGTLVTTSSFCAQNYLKNTCNDLKDPQKGRYAFTTASFTINTTETFSCSSSNIGQVQVLYSTSRDYTIKACLETGTYNFAP